MVDSRPLYYKTEQEDNLHSISRMFNVSQGTIQRWNRMDDAELNTGEVLLVGWIAYDKSQKPFPVATTARPDSPIAKLPKSDPVVLNKEKPVARLLKDTVFRPIPVRDSIEEVEETVLEKQFKEENQE